MENYKIYSTNVNFVVEFYLRIMNYQETLDYLFTQLPMYQRQGASAYKSDLETTLALDEHFRNPHRMYSTIHVAGTNGKGSVSHMLASALQEAGYKTGLYTSPHLRDFRERIRINGEMIDEEFVVRFVDYNNSIIHELTPSFFEITAALAFDYFARERVDIAVVETGMGGRLDSTNIIQPIVSVITNIGLDHIQFLGTTIPTIAAEKAGIMKPETPVVIGEKQAEAMDVYRMRSDELAAPVYVAQDRFKVTDVYAKPPFATQKITIHDMFTKADDVWELDLAGNYQSRNLVTVLTTLDVVRGKFPVSDSQLKRALLHVKQNTGFAGRWQVLNTKPLTIADTGHNREGLSMVLKQISEIKIKTLHVVFGVVDDKNIDDVLTMLPCDAIYYFTRATIPRALDENILREKAEANNLIGKSYHSVCEAFDAARGAANLDDMIYVGGSTFVVAEVV